MTGNSKLFLFRLADALISENKLDSAEKVLDRCYKLFPASVIPYDGMDYFYIGRTYLQCGTPTSIVKGIARYDQYADQLIEEITYLNKFTGKKAEIVKEEKGRRYYYMNTIFQLCSMFSSTLDAQYKNALDAVVQKTQPYVGTQGQ